MIRYFTAALATVCSLALVGDAAAAERLKQANAHGAVEWAAVAYDSQLANPAYTFVASERAGRRLSPTAFRFTATRIENLGGGEPRVTNLTYVARLGENGIVVTERG